MTTPNNPEQEPLKGDDRLDDALLRELARAGTGADEQFLARMETALDADARNADARDPEDVFPADVPLPTRRQPSRRLVGWLGVAATFTLIAGLTWAILNVSGGRTQTAREHRDRNMVRLQTDLPAENIEGTPRRIHLPRTTPDSDSYKYRTEHTAQAPVTRPSGPSPRPTPRPAPPAPVRPALTSIEELRPPQHRQAPHPAGPDVSGERYGELIDNSWQSATKTPLSTFSIDVDTASYSNLRRLATDGQRIPADAVRLEEMVNYFDYSYAPPSDEHPFAVHVGNAACPWNPDHQLVRVALKGREIARTERAPANLVFLLDVSGSMNRPDKLPLVISAFQLLLEEMNGSDTLTIVVYAGAEGLALPPTRCDAAGRERIAAALRNLTAGGSTNGGAGIQLAYSVAREHFKPGGINRVILATDGDFNVGVTGNNGLVRLVEDNARSNVFLTVLGFGTGNLNDSMLEAITNKGNGTYHYIDTQREARRVFLRKLMGTLVTIAKDVKIQVEFNPAQVRSYRLLGYANRMLRKEDFANDRIDAGDIGSGHTVTAFYEVVTGDSSITDPAKKLRYQPAEPEKADRSTPRSTDNPEWLLVKLRYKQPDGDRSTLMKHPFTGSPRDLGEADTDFRFATSVAMAGLLLRHTEGTEGCRFADVARLASQSLGADPHGQRAEFLALVKHLDRRAN